MQPDPACSLLSDWNPNTFAPLVLLLPLLLLQVGFNLNLWSGLQLLHFLFAKEHNHVCDKLKKEHPDW